VADQFLIDPAPDVTLTGLTDAEVLALRVVFEDYACSFEEMAVHVPEPPDVPETPEEAASDMRQAAELRAAIASVEQGRTLTFDPEWLASMVRPFTNEQAPTRLVVTGCSSLMRRLETAGA
jgi:hypothetical protein